MSLIKGTINGLSLAFLVLVLAGLAALTAHGYPILMQLIDALALK